MVKDTPPPRDWVHDALAVLIAFLWALVERMRSKS
jgi:hypothetical protein